MMFVVGRKKKTGSSSVNRLQRALGQRKKKEKRKRKKKGERRREWLHFSKNKTNVVCCWQETKHKKKPRGRELWRREPTGHCFTHEIKLTPAIKLAHRMDIHKDIQNHNINIYTYL